jgi:hypothetical protein
LASTGSVELMSFSAMELAAVGAGSPLRGLVADEAFLDLEDRNLGEALGRARRALAGRGLVGPAGPGRDSVAARDGDSQVDFELGGDLAAVVAVRRQPALIATVSAAAPDRYRRPGSHPGSEARLAVLHGVASEASGLFALLEETRAGRTMHLFTLCTPAAQGDRIFEAWQELEANGPAAVSVQVFRPDPVSPRRTQLVLQAGVARLSADGAAWQRSVPEDGWNRLFRSALDL